MLTPVLIVMQAGGGHSMAPGGQGRAGKVGRGSEDAVQDLPGVPPEAVGQRGPLVALAL